MATIGLLVCGAFSEKIMEKHDGVYEDFFVRAFRAVDPTLQCHTYRVFEGDFPQSPDQCDGWLVSGSASSVYEELDWITSLMDFVRTCYKQGRPLVGICFGHQLIAQALGGLVVKADVGWGLGLQRYEVLQKVPMLPEDTQLSLYAIHQDQVVKLPADAEVVAQAPYCPYAALRYGEKAVSFQAHPEFTKEFEVDLIESLAGERFSQAVAAEAISGLGAHEVHNKEIMTYLAAFLSGKK